MTAHIPNAAEAAHKLEYIISVLERNAISDKAHIFCDYFFSENGRLSLSYAPCKADHSVLRYDAFRAFGTLPIFSVSYDSFTASEVTEFLPSVHSGDACAENSKMLKQDFNTFSSFLIDECCDKARSQAEIAAFHVLLTDNSILTVLSNTVSGLLDNVFQAEEYLRILSGRKEQMQHVINSAGEKLNVIMERHRIFLNGENTYFSSSCK